MLYWVIIEIYKIEQGDCGYRCKRTLYGGEEQKNLCHMVTHPGGNVTEVV